MLASWYMGLLATYLSYKVGQLVHGVAGPLCLPLDRGVPAPLVTAHDFVHYLTHLVLITACNVTSFQAQNF